MKTVEFPDGGRVSALGQGTWRMCEDKTKHKDEVAALLLGIELGMTLIVSNFDVDGMEELWRVGSIAATCSANQVLYNLQHRQIEFDLLPSPQPSTNASPARTNHRPVVMAYSPIGHGRGLLNNVTLKKIAQRHDATCHAKASREGSTCLLAIFAYLTVRASA